MTKLTRMEKMVLNTLRDNCFNDCYQDDGTFAWVAEDYSGLGGKVARGVVSSLVKKGLVEVERFPGEDDYICFTDAGKALFDNADGEECGWGGPRLLKIEDEVETETKNTENKEDKTMTVKEMREQAKALGIKGYSRMSKAELQTALSAQETVETTEIKDEPEMVEVIMKAFTGMVIGTFTAEYENRIYTVTTKAGKQLHFTAWGEEIIEPGTKNPKFANKLERYTPDAFLTGDFTTARGGSIFHVVSATKEQMNELGHHILFNADDPQYIIMGDGTDAYAVAK